MSEHSPNPDYEYDPGKSALDNIYAAYHGEPPEDEKNFGIFLDTTTDLLEQHRRGEISADEFMRRHNEAADYFDSQDGRPGDN